MRFQSTIYYLKEYFFPSGCGGCGKALGPADARYGLCEKCRTAFGIALVIGRRCRCCGKPLITERELCLPCRDDTGREKPAGGKEAAENARCDGSYSEHIKKLRVLFPYAGKFRTALGSFKFEKATALGIFFARCLSLSLEAFGLQVPGTGALEPQALKKAAWVPVPPRPGKLKAHGWDQVEFLAKQLGKAARPPVKRCLKRLPSKSQKLLGREERLANLKGRIRCVKKPPETAILFDDVITTGATIDACAAALLKAGAKQVYAVCLFYR
jgi:ComF family protein